MGLLRTAVGSIKYNSKQTEFKKCYGKRLQYLCVAVNFAGKSDRVK